ncbi:hypothetical protein CN878_22140 [Ochrobactrum sp. 695/2009]|uniref:Uncharacterized protein n=1 Tax=Brucella intermedia TaxID=94625 RepID=A0A7V6PCR9_9HYPH|nr:hypothetical protein CN881_07510 [Ochrobactrum sp. 721/2009]PJT15776.1 hypothetical protein CN880_12455 [Ochrobactrum sp. 720/2009]PJT18365.1 hypothetical protein CN879_22295 [Ochrobactrum sp. 715/2009]PJT24007.1 hypothetical protein CN878_22140 [Ochrobactrum sp. 695/2009]PJT33538.1 hypothetical protein CN877_13815 [Ochrobactrum sp. 689/2009]HHV68614.1 hypothetical protein [Brucella intermedia]
MTRTANVSDPADENIRTAFALSDPSRLSSDGRLCVGNLLVRNGRAEEVLDYIDGVDAGVHA